MTQFKRVVAKVEEFAPEHTIIAVHAGGSTWYACSCRRFLTVELALVAKHAVRTQKAV